MLRQVFLAKTNFYNGLALIHYVCDGVNYKKMTKQELALCDGYVFIDTGFRVKIGPVFEVPCTFYPRFSEGLCAVSIKGMMSYIDTTGKVKFSLGLKSCTPKEWVNAGPFNKGIAVINTGDNKSNKPLKKFYINTSGEKVRKPFIIPAVLAGIAGSKKPYIPKPQDPAIVANRPPDLVIVEDTENNNNGNNNNDNNNNGNLNPGKTYIHDKWLLDDKAKKAFYARKPFVNGIAFVEYKCNDKILSQIDEQTATYCGKYVFVDSALNVKFPVAFDKPCAFLPEFSEGLSPASVNGKIVYINLKGETVINLNIPNCGAEMIVPGPFEDSVAVIQKGNPETNGFDPLYRIDRQGNKLPNLGFDNLLPAAYGVGKYTGLTVADTPGRYIGKGPTNGIWFLVDAKGRVLRKLDRIVK